MPFHFIACITLYDTYWHLARVGAWKFLAFMEYVACLGMIWHSLILNLFEINYCKVDEKQQRNNSHLKCTKTLHLAPIGA